MTFKEATKLKGNQPKEIRLFEDDLIYKVYIMPLLEVDFGNYMDFLKSHKNHKDEFAKLYSTNNEYLVYAICFLDFKSSALYSLLK